MLQRKNRAGSRPYTFTVYIPARYEVRHSKAERVVWLLLSPIVILLAGYGLLGVLGAGGSLLLMDPLTGGGLLWAALLCLLFVPLMLLCPLLAVKSRRDLLMADGETLTLRRWRREDLTFSFSDIGTVQTRQGRETVVLRDRQGRTLCRLNVTMEGLDVLLADLQSRRALFVEGANRAPAVPPPLLSPGPRREEQVLDLPGQVPGWYFLRNPGLYTGVFAGAGVIILGIAALAFRDGARAEALCLTPFVLLAVLGMAWTRMERIEVIGDRIRRRDGLGRVKDFAFADVAAVRIRTSVTGIGPISSFRLLDRTGEILLAPGVGMTGTGLLLADLIRRGVSFTY